MKNSVCEQSCSESLRSETVRSERFQFEEWDAGRLTVNAEFADIFRHQQLVSFAALMNHSGGDGATENVAKNLLQERITSRLSLRDADGREFIFYIKRHLAPPLKEYVKPLLRLTKPIIGARNEWKAMLQFHAANIATMVPVALGEQGGQSFVVTLAVEGCDQLSHWMDEHLAGGSREKIAPSEKRKPRDEKKVAAIIENIANIARRMHNAGLHHQDFYLTHLLMPQDTCSQEKDSHKTASHKNVSADNPLGICVIDLGRARKSRRLSQRWIVKDLAQLNYSATHFNDDDRQRFLTAYLGRPAQPSDRPFLQRIQRKTERIARHSRKNRL